MSERAVSLVRDVLSVSGAGLIAFGAWRIYSPAGYIVAGLLLLAAGLAGALRSE
jgi:hypothetical protein